MPADALLGRQTEWKECARAQLLRQIGIARRKRVLDLGAGYGAVSGELSRRAGGMVVALDHAVAALQVAAASFGSAYRVGGDAVYLPFADATFDLVFTQLTLLWVHPLEQALREIVRVLAREGVLIALEPDYGGMIEYPPAIATSDLWLNGLQHAGADPFIGRKLPTQLAACGLRVKVNLFDTLYAPDAARFDFLRDLPLDAAEKATLQKIEREAAKRQQPWAQVAHVPFFLVTAVKTMG